MLAWTAESRNHIPDKYVIVSADTDNPGDYRSLMSAPQKLPEPAGFPGYGIEVRLVAASLINAWLMYDKYIFSRSKDKTGYNLKMLVQCVIFNLSTVYKGVWSSYTFEYTY